MFTWRGVGTFLQRLMFLIDLDFNIKTEPALKKNVTTVCEQK